MTNSELYKQLLIEGARAFIVYLRELRFIERERKRVLDEAVDASRRQAVDKVKKRITQL